MWLVWQGPWMHHIVSFFLLKFNSKSVFTKLVLVGFELGSAGQVQVQVRVLSHLKKDPNKKISIWKSFRTNILGILCWSHIVEQIVSNKLCRTNFVEQTLSNKLCRTNYVEHTFVEQTLSNILCRTNFAEHSLSNILCRTNFCQTNCVEVIDVIHLVSWLLFRQINNRLWLLINDVNCRHWNDDTKWRRRRRRQSKGPNWMEMKNESEITVLATLTHIRKTLHTL